MTPSDNRRDAVLTAPPRCNDAIPCSTPRDVRERPGPVLEHGVLEASPGTIVCILTEYLETLPPSSPIGQVSISLAIAGEQPPTLSDLARVRVVANGRAVLASPVHIVLDYDADMEPVGCTVTYGWEVVR